MADNIDSFLDGKTDSLGDNQSVDAFLDGKTDNLNEGTSKMDRFKSLVGESAKQALTSPLSAFKQYMTDPTAQANSLPLIMGTAGGVGGLLLGGPGGASALGSTGAMAGTTLRDVVLTAMGNKDAPQTTGDAVENLATNGFLGATGGGALDAASAIQRMASAGSRIAAAEEAAKITKLPLSADEIPGPKDAGDVLKALDAQLRAGTITDPNDAMKAKQISDYIWDNPMLLGKDKMRSVLAAQVSKAANQLLNDVVPGRAAPSADFATYAKYFRGPMETAGNALSSGPAKVAYALAAALGLKNYFH